MNWLSANYTKNAAGLMKMADKARATGRKVNGYTLAELETRAARFVELAALDDAGMRAHLAMTKASIAAELAELRARG